MHGCMYAQFVSATTINGDDSFAFTLDKVELVEHLEAVTVPYTDNINHRYFICFYIVNCI